MQKISPLKSSIEAFNKFKAMRANKTSKAETKQDSVAQTNPFGITFRGTVIQMDVFEKAENLSHNVIPSLPELYQACYTINNTGISVYC